MFWRWIFPTGANSDSISAILRGAASSVAASLVNCVVPGECLACNTVLRHPGRHRYCLECIAGVPAMTPEYFCDRCRTPFVNDSALDHFGVCLRCRTGLSGYDYAYSYGFYEDLLRELIHEFKYAFVEPLGAPLGALMARALPLDLRVDVIVPVPLHWRRKIWRGFNQAEALARPVARRLQAPVVNALRKTRYTESQAQSTPSTRRSQLTGAFVLADRQAVEGRHVLLIDDVLTTGSTVTACSRLLRSAGAKTITALTLARVDRRMTPSMEGLMARNASGGTN